MKEKLNKLKVLLNGKLGALTKEKKPLVIAAAGILGILLIVLSSLPNESVKEDTDGTDTLAQYEQRLTEELTALVGSIEGAGRVKVMLTMECSKESVFASDTKEKTDNEKNEKIGSDKEVEYIIIKGSGSGETGLLRVMLEPKVRGVSVVCDGGDIMTVKREITEAVGAVLGIGSHCVSVSKMAQNTGG